MPDGLAVLDDHRVHGPHEGGGIGELVKIGKHEGFKRHGDVVPGEAHGLHPLDHRFDIVGLHIEHHVGVIEPHLVERGVVHSRRHGMFDRAADERDRFSVTRDAQFFCHGCLLRLPSIGCHGLIIHHMR